MAQILLQTVWLIPCYPLIGGVLSMLWFPAVTRRTGPRPSGYVNAILTLIAFLHGVIALTAIWNQPAQHQFIPWLNVAGLNINHSRRNLCCHRRGDSFDYRTELAGTDLCFRLHGNGLGLG